MEAHEETVAVVEPLRSDSLDVRRGDMPVAEDVGLQLARVAEKRVVRIQEIGLPSEPADPFEAGDEVVLLLRLRAGELLGRRTRFGQFRDLLADRLLDLRERGSGPRRRDDDELPGDLVCVVEGVDVRAERLVVDERLVQARRESVGQAVSYTHLTLPTT